MSHDPAVLILTQSGDVTADYVVEELNRRGTPVFRCDPGDFPTALSLTAELDGGWTGSLRLAERTLSLGDVACAWYRRPSAFAFPDGLNPEERRWAQAEARLGLGGVLASLPRWLNHPADMARASYKPLQLRLARAGGMTVPPTLITNDPDAARSFAARHGQVVYKPLSPVTVSEQQIHKLLYANLVGADEITDTVSATAHLFQAWVDKAYEARVTVVDDALFVVRIDAWSAAGHVDWRRDYDGLRYTVIDAPDGVRDGVLALLRSLRLRFAALDFVISPDGAWTFLEANPNGQWAWLQDETGIPIAAAIADALTARDRTGE